MNNTDAFENDPSVLPEQETSPGASTVSDSQADTRQADPFQTEPDVAPDKRSRRKPPREQRPAAQRRIGTMTMGFALIITGVVALISMFYPAFDMVTVFKLSPVLFVLLGAEILFNYAFHKGERLKYDFLSGFVCFALICAGGCLAIAPTLWKYAGPPAMEARENLDREVQDRVYDLLKDTHQIESMYSYVNHFAYGAYSQDISLEELLSSTPINLNFKLVGPFQTDMEFAEVCRMVLERTETLPYRINSIKFSYYADHLNMQLKVNDKFQFNLDTAGLAKQVDSEIYNVSSEADIVSATEYSQNDIDVAAETAS